MQAYLGKRVNYSYGCNKNLEMKTLYISRKKIAGIKCFKVSTAEMMENCSPYQMQTVELRIDKNKICKTAMMNQKHLDTKWVNMWIMFFWVLTLFSHPKCKRSGKVKSFVNMTFCKYVIGNLIVFCSCILF